MQYLAHWPEYFQVLEAPNGDIMGYSKYILKEMFSNFMLSVMGKVEGHGDQWHGHVTAVSVAPDYRRLNLAAKLMKGLESVSEK